MGEFVTVGKASNVPEGEFLVAEVDGQNVVVAHVEGEFYAIGEECHHAGGPLGDGTLDGWEIECPWHASRFDVRTGEATMPPATEPVPTYAVMIDGDDIQVASA